MQAGSLRYVGKVSLVRLGGRSGGAMQGGEKGGEFFRVEPVLRAHAAAQIEPERGDLSDGGGDVGGGESAGQKDRHIDGLADASAQSPVVHAAGAAQFFDRERGVAGVE